MKHIYFVRHGETESNIDGLYQSPEIPLSAKGLEGAKAVAERCAHLDIDVVVASPFMRAQQTAEHITQVTKKSLVTLEHAHEVLNAKNMWGKHFYSKEAKEYEIERKANVLNPDWGPEGAENYFTVSKRVNTCIAYLEAHEAENIVLVSHGNFLRYLIARLLLEKSDNPQANMSVYRSIRRMSNVAITKFVFDQEDWKMITWNDFAHFAE